MEKINVYTDRSTLAQYKQNREKLNGHIEEFARQLGEINLNFNKETLVRFQKEGTGYVWMLLRGQLEKDFEKMKINSGVAKENLLKGISEKSDEFKLIHEKILAGLLACGIQAKDISIQGGKPITSDKELEAKKRELSVFIETDDQHQLWKILQNGCKYLNDLEVFLKKRELPSIFKLGSPDNLTDYILLRKDPEFKIPETQQNIGLMWPMQGGIICEPNPTAISNIPRKRKQLKQA